MHTYNANGVNFNYNSDLSGEVWISTDGREIRVPGEALLNFIGYCYVLPHRINKLEQAEAKELLLGRRQGR